MVQGTENQESSLVHHAFAISNSKEDCPQNTTISGQLLPRRPLLLVRQHPRRCAFLLRCGRADPSLDRRSVGLTRCYISSERHPTSPAQRRLTHILTMPMKRQKPEDLYFLHKCKPHRSTSVKRIRNFDARGMVYVYGQGDHFGDRMSSHMNAWRTHGGRLLVRFWSRRAVLERISYKILGLAASRQPTAGLRESGGYLDSSWILRALRKRYHEWIVGELELNDPARLTGASFVELHPR
jgi:hypothetical protein